MTMPEEPASGTSRHSAISTLVVLGGLGDLTTRFLLPAVAELVTAGAVSDSLRVLAVDRADITDDEYRDQVGIDELRPRLQYRRASATDAAELRAAFDGLDGAAAVYLALPNTVFQSTIEALAQAGLPAGSRLVVEKPFGVDRADARRLNNLIRNEFREDHVFRIDHVLADRVVLGVLGARLAGRVLETMWNTQHIESVDVVWDETIALEGRAGYYDHAGALRDMIQNHLLQMLAMVAMEPPASLDERELRDRKADVLRAVRPPDADEMRARTRRARYTAGRSPTGERIPSYAEEPDVEPSRMTETYAEVIVTIENRRWAGVPFRLRSGKALDSDRREFVIRFRPPAYQPFDPPPPPEELRFGLGPNRIELALNTTGSGEPFGLQRAMLAAGLGGQQLSPYARLLSEVLDGDPTLAVRGDEAEECWRIVEPVLAAWAAGDVPLEEYQAGSAPAPRP